MRLTTGADMIRVIFSPLVGAQPLVTYYNLLALKVIDQLSTSTRLCI